MVRKKKKQSSRNKRTIFVIAILIIGCWKLATDLRSNEQTDTKAQTETSSSTSYDRDFGNLLDVKTNPSLASVEKRYTGMDLSFNPDCHIPNWVAWELTADETTGKEPRSDKFSADPDVVGCAETWDYSYSGYDRGHMAPAGDMKWDKQAMEETFFLTNICPQTKALNVGAWRTLEEKCRQWAREEGRIYIVCGPVIESKPIERIGDSRVWVPKRFFKVIIAPYATPPRGIAFIMPNDRVKGGMQQCVVSIDSVERLTGHDFFHTLPDYIENDVESQHKFSQWEYNKNRKKQNKN